MEEKDVKDEFFNGDLSRLSNETEQAFSETFNNLMSEYDTPLTTIRTMSKQESLNNTAFATTHHNYEIDNAEIIINPIKCKDAEKLSERLADLMDRGYAVKIDDPMQYVPTHEFAHTLFNIGEKLNNSRNFVGADYDKIRKVRKEVLSVYDKYTKEINDITNRAKQHESDFILNFSEESAQKAREEFKKLDAIKISKYSLTNSDEFMAEAFTQYKLGKNKSPYADMIGKIIDDNFKR